MKRRKFLNTTKQLMGLGLLAGLYTWRVEPYWLEFVHRKLPIRNLPLGLVGKTLMQISDIHIGNRWNPNFVIASFQRARALNPDIVVYTGDYVTYDGPEQIGQLRDVMQHAVRGRLGTAAVLGNHDYGKNWLEPEVADQICAVLTGADIVVLRNEATRIAGLTVAGMDDLYGTNFDPEVVTGEYDPADANLLLCHNPDVCDLDVWNGYEGWILAGHTHGGQCKPPFLDPPVLATKNRNLIAGEYDLGDGRQLYINRALGHSWPVRFNVRPEITVFEFKRG